ncbi:hypothetical protein NDU88_004779 [Pleurodeles waltl]|uniref:Uncharacterized protein n=1 Tax=Pleurodeles waltl TaxID=8319 RepID=A0AAV7TS88_PLEWA|nr:hypothetical protein NDU88_004779 [Pleurodeles waltl]
MLRTAEVGFSFAPSVSFPHVRFVTVGSQETLSAAHVPQPKAAADDGKRRVPRLPREDLSSKLDQLSFGTNGAEEVWTAFSDVVYNTAIAHTSKQQEWVDDNEKDIQKLLDEKCEVFKSLQKDTTSASKKTAYNSIKSKVQAKLREMQDSLLSRKADEMQKYADSNNFKHFYDVLKTNYGPQFSGTSPLLGANGSILLTDKKAILKR